MKKIELKKGRFIFDSRQILISSGWLPLEIFEKTGAILDREIGSALPIFQAGVIEVEFCSGIGLNYCKFNYRKAAQCLQILTGGEYFKEDGSPKVISWELIDCESLVTHRE